MTAFTIASVLDRFPEYVAGIVIADGIAPELDSLPFVRTALDEARASATERLRDRDLAIVPELSCWRHAYKAFGVKGTTYRSSVERLARLALRTDRDLPRVGPLVDAYNVVSLQHLVPVGADDVAKLRFPLSFRPASGSERFIPLGSESGQVEHPEPGEIVYADSERVLCRRWNWYQSAETAVSPDTKRALLTVQALGAGAAARVESAVARLDGLLQQVCRSRQTFVLLSAESPEVTSERLGL